MGVTLINAVEVPAGADEAFIAGWQRAREVLAGKAGVGAATLHRALRRDAHLRFVEVAPVDSPQAWQAATGDQEMPFPAHAGLYEVVREDGDVDGSGGVLLITAFEAPDGADDAFLGAWERARDVLAERQGSIGSRLHRSLGDADFRYVGIARWSSPLMVARALRLPEVQQAVEAMPFRSHPALYEIVARWRELTDHPP